jgi:hypothetical protein
MILVIFFMVLRAILIDYLSVASSRVKLSKKNCLALGDVTDRKSGNVGFKPPYAT